VLPPLQMHPQSFVRSVVAVYSDSPYRTLRFPALFPDLWSVVCNARPVRCSYPSPPRGPGADGASALIPSRLPSSCFRLFPWLCQSECAPRAFITRLSTQSSCHPSCTLGRKRSW
jgi:hypothetical protein